MTERPSTGKIALFGSGETARQGRQIQERLLLQYPLPVRVSILETPAGFQPNVDVVSAKLRTFYEEHVQNAQPLVTVVSARRRGGALDPDDPAIAARLEQADVIVAGPGSPTYTVRHLANTLTLQAIRDRFHGGGTLILSSAAAIAAGAYALPVYEIYKVGDDPFWAPGLDLLAEIGWQIAVVPHWNNKEGGADLDTSRAYVGLDRFRRLTALLPPGVPLLGIDEHTAVVIDPARDQADVQGAGSATLIVDGAETVVAAGQRFELSALRRTEQAA